MLKKLTLFFCDSSPGSATVRDYILNKLPALADVQKGTVFAVTARNRKAPVVKGEYGNHFSNADRSWRGVADKRWIVNGYAKTISLREPVQLEKTIQLLLDGSGMPPQRIRHPMVKTTENSPRKMWSPFDGPPLDISKVNGANKTFVEDFRPIVKQAERQRIAKKVGEGEMRRFVKAQKYEKQERIVVAEALR